MPFDYLTYSFFNSSVHRSLAQTDFILLAFELYTQLSILGVYSAFTYLPLHANYALLYYTYIVLPFAHAYI